MYLRKFKIEYINEKTALHEAVLKGNYEIIQLLLFHQGIDINSTDEILIHFLF